MDLNTVWFLLIGVLLAGYAVLDGFDLGVGVLHLFAQDEQQRRIHYRAIGPVWDGNQVWLLTAGGAMFAAFPVVYATVFSGFYLAFMLLLFALILRAVSLEFRKEINAPGWQKLWDLAFTVGSLVPALLYGVAIGNLLRGLPIEADGALNVSLVALLNPYALLIGVVGLTMFVMHGAAFLAARTEGTLQEQMARWTIASWTALVTLYLLATAVTFYISPIIFSVALGNPLSWALLAIVLAAAVSIPLAVRRGRFTRAFLASTVVVVTMVGLVGVGLYPRLAPSSINLANSLTIYNASSSPRTLAVMLIITAIGMPLVIAYTVYVYKVFMGKVSLAEDGY